MTTLAPFTCTILNSATTSDAIHLGGIVPTSILIPAAFTGANLSFLVSSDGVTYAALYKTGANLSVAIAASKCVVLSPADFAGAEYLKIVSDATEAGDRTLTVTARW